MSDDLLLPQVPEARPEDPEDVSWALSTAEAMWARGDHSEGIKWVRRAAEAASEAENDSRALELAKAAADLAGMIARQTSRGSIDLEEVAPAAPPPVPPARPAAKPTAKPIAASPAPPKPAPAAAPAKPPLTPSRPPAPAVGSTTARMSSAPVAPKTKDKVFGAAPASVRGAAMGKKTSRKSRENFDASLLPAEPVTAPRLPADTGETLAVQVPHRRRSRPDLGNNDPTIVGHVSDLTAHGRTDEWDAAPAMDGDRKTAVGAPPNFKSTMHSTPRTASSGSSPPPATVAGAMLGSSFGAAKAAGRAAAPTNEQHDPGIMTSQAVRVVVWRDANGVHVAPAGTVVSAITVDAVLVALEPSADLTAWLSTGQQRR